MKLEDKYWALFLVGLFVLTVCSLTYEDGKHGTLSGKGKHEPLPDDREK
jgi:hypothetical protein